jgi:transposase
MQKTRHFNELQKYDFKKLLKNNKNLKIRENLLAIALVKKGKRMSKVAKIFNVHSQTVRNWVERFIKEGIRGLDRKPGQGRKRILTEDEAFKASVLEMQKKKPGGVITGNDILKMMEEKFNVKPCLNSVYVYLKRAKLVWITGRSKHPNMNKEAQDTFKKTLKVY